MKLSEMPNIGKIVELKLNEVGIFSPQELIDLGSREAFTRLRIVDSGACFCMLCGLEGAIQGIRWHNLTNKDKDELRIFFNSMKQEPVNNMNQ